VTVSFTLRPLQPYPRYQVNRRLDGPQGRITRTDEDSLPLPEIEPRPPARKLITKLSNPGPSVCEAGNKSMRSFIICSLHQILMQWKCQGGWDVPSCSILTRSQPHGTPIKLFPPSVCTHATTQERLEEFPRNLIQGSLTMSTHSSFGYNNWYFTWRPTCISAGRSGRVGCPHPGNSCGRFCHSRGQR
jgi:hypothetical protein